jgi:hypothetical protein
VARSSGEPALGPELAALVQSGVAVGVGTRDDDLKPAFSRGWGPEVAADGRTVTLCVSAPAGSPTRADLEGNGAIAVTFTLPTVARSVQVKGRAGEVREPEPHELERAERHLRAFIVEAEQVGARAELARRMFGDRDFVTVTLEIDEVYDQTPGPKAGRRL